MTAIRYSLRYTPGPYRYNPACACDFCANGGSNPNPLMVVQGGSYGYAEPHMPPGSRAPWAAPDGEGAALLPRGASTVARGRHAT